MFPKFSSALLFAALAAVAMADTVTLKSGEKIEGKVTAETATELTIEMRMGGVIDERKVSKAEVAEVSKVAADDLAWNALKGLKLWDSSLATAEQYDPYIGPLNAFIAQFPASAHKDDAAKLLGEFEGEKAKVAAGEVKLKGTWLSKEQVQRDRYQINGAIAANYMAAQLAANDSVGAMNTFEVLAKQYGGSRGYVESIDLARRTAAALKTAAQQRLVALPAEDATRQKGVAAAAGLEQVKLKQELEAEKKSNEAALLDAKKRGAVWPPFLRRSDVALKEIVKQADNTERTLVSFDKTKALQSLDLAEQAQADLESKEYKAAEEKLKQAQSLWPNNEMLKRLTTALNEAKSAAATAEAEVKAEAAKATPKPVVRASTPAPTDTASEKPEAEPTNWFLIGVGGALLVILLVVAYVAYSKVRKKSNEIIA